MLNGSFHEEEWGSEVIDGPVFQASAVPSTSEIVIDDENADLSGPTYDPLSEEELRSRHHKGPVKKQFIEDKTARRKTFSKRKKTLMKQAEMLATLTGSKVFLRIEWDHGKTFEYESHPRRRRHVQLQVGARCVVRGVEEADPVLNSKQQINRLNRPGSMYFNLNPFDVLQVGPDTPPEQVKRKYRQLLILVHPEKNLDRKELAQKAFDAVKRAWGLLNNPEEKEKCLEVVADARIQLETKLKAKRKKLRKEGKPTAIPEDNPQVYETELHKETCKLFANIAIIQEEMETPKKKGRKRKSRQEAEEKARAEQQKEWDENFEEDLGGGAPSFKLFKKDTKRKRGRYGGKVQAT